MPWNPSEIPDQSGRVAVITGANSGIGFKAARHLAAKGATVIMACRNLEKARAARARLPAEANVRIVELDLGSQASVKKAAEEILAEYPRLDLLLNNAGIMWLEEGRTEDGAIKPPAPADGDPDGKVDRRDRGDLARVDDTRLRIIQRAGDGRDDRGEGENKELIALD